MFTGLIIWRPPQLWWAHEINWPDMFTVKATLLHFGLLWPLVLTVFLPTLWFRCLICNWALYTYLFSTHWLSVTFCINHYPLHNQISLKRSVNCTNLWGIRDTSSESNLIVGTIHSCCIWVPHHEFLAGLFIGPDMHFLLECAISPTRKHLVFPITLVPCLSGACTAPSSIPRAGQQGGASLSALTWFLLVLEKYVVSSEIEAYHHQLVSHQDV